MINEKLGVFICDCGDNIASILDMDTLESKVRELPWVTSVQRLNYSCSPEGLETIRSAIIKEGLGRVLVAGCTPRTLERHFLTACENASRDDYLFELVDIREGCAWAHKEDPLGATVKALDLIRMGVGRLALRQASHPISAEVKSAALVIGGGVTGMTAALTLANAGQPVKLVEREATLGGMLRDMHTLDSDQSNGVKLIAQKVEEVTNHPRIEVLLESQVTDVSGTVGHYSVNINGADQQFNVGTIIVATGARTLKPWGHFCYDGKRVVTQLEFERELQGTETGTTSTSLPISDLVMILCAAQRNQEIPYCSGVCCISALNQALEVKAVNPQVNVTILFRDLNLGSENNCEERLIEVQQAGVKFIHYTPSIPPKVTREAVEVYDNLADAPIRLPYDRVVLATPLIPQQDANVVSHMLGIAQDENGFFPEMRYRLRPQNNIERGLYVCGAAHYPTGRAEAEFQATSAALKALHHLRAGKVISHANFAVVDERLCTGCGSCVESCPFGAISMHKGDGELDLSQIDPLLCTGCGNCVVVCPVKAISQPVDSDAQMLVQIEEALATAKQNGRLCILVFGCEWSGYAAAELAGSNKQSYPVETRLIRLGCSTRLDPTHVLWAFFSGADGIFLGACHPGDCHYASGNRHAQERFITLRGLLTESGFDPRRLRLEWITPDDPNDFVNKITDFTNLMRALGPSPFPSQ